MFRSEKERGRRKRERCLSLEIKGRGGKDKSKNDVAPGSWMHRNTEARQTLMTDLSHFLKTNDILDLELRISKPSRTSDQKFNVRNNTRAEQFATVLRSSFDEISRTKKERETNFNRCLLQRKLFYAPIRTLKKKRI